MKTLRFLLIVGLISALCLPQTFADETSKYDKSIKKVRRSLINVCKYISIEEIICQDESARLIVTVVVNEAKELVLVDVQGENEKCIECFKRSFNKRTIRSKNFNPGCKYQIPLTLMHKDV